MMIAFPLQRDSGARAARNLDFFRALLMFCDLDGSRWREYPRGKRAWSERFVSFDSLERRARSREKPNRTRRRWRRASGALPNLLGAALQFRAQSRTLGA